MELQGHADAFVDVSDIGALRLPMARAALQDGIRLVGDDRDVDAYRRSARRSSRLLFGVE
ncbi:hypothetical protein [Halorubrum sp. GN11_10-6_MGM]|uniref:hypothetical protein n=1 Tax=Halorubrum sp. GN11_10-6_MGM TaxID=2518112 RepID=UPI001F547B18|nr:hypothetical protein [Halorubrum sp. GN11_10-6_MGM]